MGAMVDVLGTALRTFRVFTDDQGFFSATGFPPGQLQRQGFSASFPPYTQRKGKCQSGSRDSIEPDASRHCLMLCNLRRAMEARTTETGIGCCDRPPIARCCDLLPDGSPVVVAKASDSDLKGTLSFLAGSSSQGFGSGSDMSTGFSLEKSFFASDTMRFGGDLGYGPGLPNAVVRTSYKHQMANGSTPEVAVTMRRLSTPGLRSCGCGLTGAVDVHVR